MIDSLQKKTFSGILWSFIENFALQGFAFIQGVILARILLPSDYGLVAMTGIFFSVSYTLIDSGFNNALIRKKDCDAIDYSTVFVTNVVLSFILCSLLCLSSWWIADFYHEPLLQEIVCANALLMFIGAFIATQGTKLTKELQFKKLSIINVIATITTGIASIVLAFWGFGVWSIVWPSLVNTIVRGLLFWHYQHWFPGFHFSLAKYKEFFSYGSRLMLSSFLNTVFNNIYPLIIGRYFTATDLGYYSRAQNYATLPPTTVSGIVGKVTFPVLSSIQDDDVRLATIYRKMLRVSAFVVFPIMIGLAVLAKPFIVLLVTEKWIVCIPLLQVLCFALMWYPVHAINLNLLYVKGRSDLFLKLEIIKKCVSVVVILASFSFGIFWMCVGQVFSSLIALVINTYYTGKLINVGLFKQLKDLVPTIFYSLSMGAMIVFANSFFHALWLQLLVGIIVGVLYYIIIAYLTHSRDLSNLYNLLHTNLHK